MSAEIAHVEAANVLAQTVRAGSERGFGHLVVAPT